MKYQSPAVLDSSPTDRSAVARSTTTSRILVGLQLQLRARHSDHTVDSTSTIALVSDVHLF
eukprot:COSAG05_NODE_125_length_17331_cov_16.188058_5_plen_61_part_00